MVFCCGFFVRELFSPSMLLHQAAKKVPCLQRFNYVLHPHVSIQQHFLQFPVEPEFPLPVGWGIFRYGKKVIPFLLPHRDWRGVDGDSPACEQRLHPRADILTSQDNFHWCRLTGQKNAKSVSLLELPALGERPPVPECSGSPLLEVCVRFTVKTKIKSRYLGSGRLCRRCLLFFRIFGPGTRGNSYGGNCTGSEKVSSME